MNASLSTGLLFAQGLLDRLTGDNVWDMAIRTALIYGFALFLVRLGKSRMFGKGTAFDIVIAFILGSTLSRAINGSAPLLPSLVAGAVLVFAHWVLGFFAYHFEPFGRFLKGRADKIVEDGKILKDALHQHHLSEHDLLEALRLEGIPDVNEVQVAHFERNGEISVIRRPQKVRLADDKA